MNDLLLQYQLNVSDGMLAIFAEGLGLPAQPFVELGIGYIPDERAWVYAERDVSGKVVGLCRRFSNGDKYMISGSKRGYVFNINPEYSPKKYDSARHNWVRCSEDIVCPICGKPDWCMVSSDSLTDPGAVLCSRVKAGCKKEIGSAGYLHIRHKQAESSTTSLLPPSDFPVIITEGMTDWAAATSLGLVAVGGPNASFDPKGLGRLVTGRKVIIVADQDDIGGKGAKKVRDVIALVAKELRVVDPPNNLKDLREWILDGATRDDFLGYVEKWCPPFHDTTLPSCAPLDLARAWLTEKHNLDEEANTLSLHKHRGQWYRYLDNAYEECGVDQLRGEVWKYLSNKEYTKTTPAGAVIESVTPTLAMVSNIIDALNTWCHIDTLPPVWLSPKHKQLDPAWLVVFRNGILDVKKFVQEGCTELMPSDPGLFTLNCIPYDYDPTAKCSYTDEVVWDVMSQDQEKWDLLWEWFGYNTIPSQIFEKLMLMVGLPGSGKGTMLSLMTAMLGEKQCVSTTFLKMGKDFGFHPLLGKLAAIMPDAHVGRGTDAGSAMENIKAITGGDPVGVNRKNKDELGCVKLFCRFTLAANTLPELPDQARALERRMNMLTFRESYRANPDPELKKRLTNELPGVMNRALEGLARLVTHMKFTVPEDSKQMMREFTMVTTPLATFLEECCVLDADELVSKRDLFVCWREWGTLNGLRPGTMMRLQQKLISFSTDIWSDKEQYHGDSVAVYRGVNLSKHGAELIGA